MQQQKELYLKSERPLRERVGVTILPTRTGDAIARIREAEQAGVQNVWMGDADYADTLTLFAAAAAQTERIRLGTAIVATYPRHPLVMARQALAIDDLAPGRLRLGIGPGGRIVVEDWFGLTQTAPLPYLKEYLEVLREALWEGSTNYQGVFFKTNYPSPHTAQVPLLISALGLRAFRLAGEVADGALSWLCPVPYLLEEALPVLRAGAEARHRPTPPLIAHQLVALTTNESAALAVTRQWLQRYARVSAYAQMFAKAGFARAITGNELELDALARTVLISGDEVTVRHRIEELLTSGLDELQLLLIPIGSEEEERKRLLRLVGTL